MTDTDLTTTNDQDAASAAVGLALRPRTAEQVWTFATKLAKSSLIPTGLRGKPEDVFVVLLVGAELELSPMQALRGVHVIEGTPNISADLAVALVRRSGLCVYFRCIETDADKATYETRRRDDPEPKRITWTAQDSAQAGLAKRGTHDKYPAAMNRARAKLALARDVYPEVLFGVYGYDEAPEYREAEVVNPEHGAARAHEAIAAANAEIPEPA